MNAERNPLQITEDFVAQMPPAQQKEVYYLADMFTRVVALEGPLGEVGMMLAAERMYAKHEEMAALLNTAGERAVRTLVDG